MILNVMLERRESLILAPQGVDLDRFGVGTSEKEGKVRKRHDYKSLKLAIGCGGLSRVGCVGGTVKGSKDS
jgi:hypothetical protein